MVKGGSVARLRDVAGRVCDRLALAMQTRAEGRSGIVIAAGDVAVLTLSSDMSDSGLRFATLIDSAAAATHGNEPLGQLLLEVCAEGDADLGRSFDESGTGSLEERETRLGPDSLDWIQYWGPAIVDRWGMEALRRGPFYRVHVYDNGGAGIWMGREPDQGMLSRRDAAAYLGLKLRPIYGRNPRTGKPVEIAWD